VVAAAASLLNLLDPASVTARLHSPGGFSAGCAWGQRAGIFPGFRSQANAGSPSGWRLIDGQALFHSRDQSIYQARDRVRQVFSVSS